MAEKDIETIIKQNKVKIFVFGVKHWRRWSPQGDKICHVSFLFCPFLSSLILIHSSPLMFYLLLSCLFLFIPWVLQINTFTTNTQAKMNEIELKKQTFLLNKTNTCAFDFCRQPISRTSCQMQRSWRWWSAACATTWTTEAQTTHSKPSKLQRHVRSVLVLVPEQIISCCCSSRTGSALALLYGTSATLEHHHFNHAVMILQSEVRVIFIIF